MDLTVISLLVVVFVIIFVLYGFYTKVIQNKNSVKEALSGIDVQLKKRYDLIPNILTIAQKYMEHERGIFEKVTELRTKAMNAASGSREKFEAEGQLDTCLKGLMVNVENYPALKADNTMIQAMQTYNEVEEHIAAARRFYNSALKELKNSIEIFPGSLFAGYAKEAAGFSFFETDAAAREPIKAADFLK